MSESVSEERKIFLAAKVPESVANRFKTALAANRKTCQSVIFDFITKYADQYVPVEKYEEILSRTS